MRQTRYITQLDTRVSGIPCKVGVRSFHRVHGSFNSTAPTDLDFYGYTDCAWDVLDRRGNPAAWLERKLTLKDYDRIDREIGEAL